VNGSDIIKAEMVLTPQAAFVGGSERPADAPAVEAAIAAVTETAPALARTSAHDRARVLDGVVAALEADADRIAADLTEESGYLTVRDMAMEVARTIEVFRQSAAVIRVGLTEALDLDAAERARNTIGIVKRVPIGPALGITAFNGPLLIAAHKVAPAIAAGVALVLKPSPRVPGAAVALARLVVEAGWPPEALAVLPVGDELTMQLIRDPRLPVVSFTGGPFGWRIKDEVPRKHVHLELGGVGAVVIAADGDVRAAAAECAAGGFVRSGQACISVQRVYVEGAAYEPFLEAFGAQVSALVTGDPGDPATQVGPLVDDAAADRVEAMIADAVAKGARVVCGGSRTGRIIAPTVLADVTPDMLLTRREAFGPVVAVARCASLAAAVEEVNAVDGAILAGVYTQDIDAALSLADAIDAGGVIVNGPTSWRVDHMPYGGVGTSGFGREGVEAMIAEYTQEKVIVIRHKPARLEGSD
jgi:acyl-CoA reductase-like NAD-dependent aldehyde dehydrogenase